MKSKIYHYYCFNAVIIINIIITIVIITIIITIDIISIIILSPDFGALNTQMFKNILFFSCIKFINSSSCILKLKDNIVC